MKNWNRHDGRRGILVLTLGVAIAASSAARSEGHYTDPYILAHRRAAEAYERFGDLPLGAVIRTDERYGPNELWQPRGWDYWNRTREPAAHPGPESLG